MTQLTSVADSVEAWRGLGVEFTPELVRALETLDRVRWAEVGRAPRFDLDNLGDDPEQFITDYAGRLVLAPQPGGLGPLETAKAEIVEAAATQVIGNARALIPQAVEQLNPKLLETAERYAEQVALLPAELTAEVLVRAGSKAVDAYTAATGLARQLDQLDQFVISTAHVQGVIPKQWEQTLRLLAPTPGELARLDAADQPSRRNDAVQQLGHRYYEAVRLGVKWELHDMRTAIRLRRELSTPAPVAFNR